MNPIIQSLKLLRLPHLQYTHIFAALRSNAISRPWPLVTRPPPSCIVFVLIPPSAAHRQLPYSAPGLPSPKPTATTHHSIRIKWPIVVLGTRKKISETIHKQHDDTTSSHSAVDKDSSILAYDAVSINYRCFGDLDVSIFIFSLDYIPWKWK